MVLPCRLLLKAGVYFAFLRNILYFIKKKIPLPNFLMLEFIYSAYVVFSVFALTLRVIPEKK